MQPIGTVVLYDQERNGRTYSWKAIVVDTRPGFVSIFVYAWNRVITVSPKNLWVWRPADEPSGSPAASGQPAAGGAS